MVVDDEHCYAEHGAVCCDERQINAERVVKRRHIALEHDLNQLYKSCDNQDKHNGFQIGQIVRNKQTVINRPRDRGGNHHNERYSHTHARGGVQLLGYAQKRADAEEFAQNVVFREDGRQKDGDQPFNGFTVHFSVPSFA